MEWLERMNRALGYIEDNITSEISLEKAAKLACSSSYHFQRMFSFITGVTLSEYIRRRRLTLAALDLQIGNDKVIDIALSYGYESPDAFTRAFQRLHGVTPSAAREPGVKLKAYPRLTFHLSVKGDKDMDYRIVDKPAFKVFGKGIRVSEKDGENYQRIPQFWAECRQSGFCTQLEKLADSKAATGKTKLGICLDYNPEQQEFLYFMAVENTRDDIPQDMIERDMPAATWAIFESVGAMPHAIQNLSKRIYTEWFPATGHERAGEFDMEVYPPGDLDSEDYRCEVWIPVVRP